MKAHDEIRDEVRKHYAAAIRGEVEEGCGSSCCAATEEPSPAMKAALSNTYAEDIGYTKEELASLPEHAATHTFGCGNPLAFAGVKEGDVVIDLGSGAGLDALLASKKVGPTGRVIGLDMTPEMIVKAEENARRAGASNVEFRLGEIEHMPVEGGSADWIISNCVISLSPDKDSVFREAFRVLKPGGRLLVSDICVKELDSAVQARLFGWSDCIGGAIEEEAYLEAVSRAGFRDVRIVDRHSLSAGTLGGFVGAGDELPAAEREERTELLRKADHKVSSVRVWAVKEE
jgi:ubiquinone/menaquinone biosynthesis C-methylase UbiE